MRKLGNIILNEYIKILLKRSTIIMLIAVILVAAGYNGMKLVQNWEEQRWVGYVYSPSYDEEIKEAEYKKYKGWEQAVKVATFLRDNHVTQNYAEDDFWMHSAAYVMVAQEELAKEYLSGGDATKAKQSQNIAEALEEAIIKKDWRAYIKTKTTLLELAMSDLNEEENTYWESKEYLENELWAVEYQVEHEIPPFHREWRYALLNEVEGYKHTLALLKRSDTGNQDPKEIRAAEEAVWIGVYRLDNHIRIATSQSGGVMDDQNRLTKGLNFWDVFTSSALGINVISVLIIIIAGSVISSEYSSGTIKYLLVNPVKRHKIFIAKYISVLSFSFIMLFVYYVFNVLISGIFFGFGDFGAPYLYVLGGKVMQGSSFLFVASKYLVASVGMICMATLAFAISSVTRSSALSIGLGVFLYLSGYSAAVIIREQNLDFGRYILFSNLELNAINEGVSLYKGQTVPFALAVIAVYMVVFLLTAWDGFVRGDVQ